MIVAHAMREKRVPRVPEGRRRVRNRNCEFRDAFSLLLQDEIKVALRFGVPNRFLLSFAEILDRKEFTYINIPVPCNADKEIQNHFQDKSGGYIRTRLS